MSHLILKKGLHCSNFKQKLHWCFRPQLYANTHIISLQNHHTQQISFNIFGWKRESGLIDFWVRLPLLRPRTTIINPPHTVYEPHWHQHAHSRLKMPDTAYPDRGIPMTQRFSLSRCTLLLISQNPNGDPIQPLKERCCFSRMNINSILSSIIPVNWFVEHLCSQVRSSVR